VGTFAGVCTVIVTSCTTEWMVDAHGGDAEQMCCVQANALGGSVTRSVELRCERRRGDTERSYKRVHTLGCITEVTEGEIAGDRQAGNAFTASRGALRLKGCDTDGEQDTVARGGNGAAPPTA